MRRAIWVASCIGIIAGAGCRKKNQDGLPPATEWQASPTGGSAGSPAPPSPPPPRAMTGASGDPHAGLDMSGDPHAGLDMSGDPHAGLDMSGNPHAGGGVDVTQMGLAAPDPDRKIDPSHRVAGSIAVDPKLASRMKPGTSVYLVVKRKGADGGPSGPALAVDKLSWTASGMRFELTEAQAMVAGTDLSGDVIVTARYDQDGDALSKEPGDITGQIAVKIPADNVALKLDTVLP